jgi:hypothetical protein
MEIDFLKIFLLPADDSALTKSGVILSVPAGLSNAIKLRERWL